MEQKRDGSVGIGESRLVFNRTGDFLFVEMGCGGRQDGAGKGRHVFNGVVCGGQQAEREVNQQRGPPL
jgi:hypothetical protein